MTIVTLKEPRMRGKYGVRHDRQGKENRTIDGIVFDSAAEANRYWELKQLEKAGKIDFLQCQPVFCLEVNGISICMYIADFQYLDKDKLKVITEDVKGVRTREYRIKKRLMKALHGIDIVEI